LDAGTNFLPIISGKMNKLTSHPQASRRNERSCQSATKVKTRVVARTRLLPPPSGM
jgi:hypothetical protein